MPRCTIAVVHQENWGRRSALGFIVTSVVLAGWFVLMTRLPASAGQDSAVPLSPIWSGVFTEAQAERGRAAYISECSDCHDTGEGPWLIGDSFFHAWFDGGLDAPLRKMRDTMPPGPRTLNEATYFDILAFLLAQTGFPPGHAELPANEGALSRIRVVNKGPIASEVPNFSLVAVIGCLTQGADGAWGVTHGTAPVRVKDDGESPPSALEAAASTPLGGETFRFVQDFPLPGTREPIANHKVQVKGILIRQTGDDHLNLSRLQSLGVRCGS